MDFFALGGNQSLGGLSSSREPHFSPLPEDSFASADSVSLDHACMESIPTSLAYPQQQQQQTSSQEAYQAEAGESTLTSVSSLNTSHYSIAPMSVSSVASKQSVGQAEIVPQLQNVVSTVNLCCKLDLRKIAQGARNAEYNPKRFAAVIMRIREPRTTSLVFNSGKLVVTGARSEESSKLAARKYARVIQKLGFPAKFSNFKVQNMVGSCDVKFPIRLEGLMLMHGQFCSYEPELFPGLIYRMVKPRIVLLVFVSGKVVLTGAKTREEIYQGFNNIYPILKSFKKK